MGVGVLVAASVGGGGGDGIGGGVDAVYPDAPSDSGGDTLADKEVSSVTKGGVSCTDEYGVGLGVSVADESGTGSEPRGE